MTSQYTGARDFEEQINHAVEGGNPPDIAIFPQPGSSPAYARSGDVLPLPDDVLAAVSENWAPIVDGLRQRRRHAVRRARQVRPQVARLVRAGAFAELGYEVPTTLDEFYALVEQTIADGNTPLCVGIGSGTATGWPFTDWIEELVLRNQGIDFYNQWVTHEIPFNSPEIVAAMQRSPTCGTPKARSTPQAGRSSSTPFSDNAAPLVDGDCLMHRQATFFASFFPEGTEYGEGRGPGHDVLLPGQRGPPTWLAATTQRRSATPPRFGP